MSEQKEERQVRRSARIRRIFKSCIRLAYFNYHWLIDEARREVDTSYMKNIRMLIRKKKTQSLISLQQKAILNKPEEDRTEEDRRYLSVVFGGMRCFRRYPEETRRRLAAVATFLYFPPRRQILREGDPPFGWYYILDGKVSVRRGDEYGHKEVQLFQKGYTFGEFELLHDKVRKRSVITLTHCEFLVIRKETFNDIMKDTVMRHYNIIRGYLKQLPCFEHYNEEDYMDACLVAKVKEYENDELVLGDDVGYSQFTYFIIKGKINIIHHLMFNADWIEKRKKFEYKLYDPMDDPRTPYFIKRMNFSDMGLRGVDKEFENVWEAPLPTVDYFHLEMVKSLPDDIHTCFIRIYKLSETGCFNIGEQLRHRFAVAETDSNSVCLLLPRIWLYKRNASFLWTRLADFLNKKIPNDQMILCEYIKMRKWESEKKEMISKLLSKSKKFNANNISNIPFSLRLTGDLSYYENPYLTFSKMPNSSKR